MGCAPSEPVGPPRGTVDKTEKNKSKIIQKQMELDEKENERETKLLLLGTGESGKSTFFKQLQTIYGKGYTQMQLNQFIPTIHSTILHCMVVLCEQSELLNEQFNTDVDFKLNPSKDFITNCVMNEGESLTVEIGQHMKLLWADPGIQKTFSLRSRFQLNDNCNYFFDNIDRVCANNFEPTFDDILKIRIRSTGIAETRFQLKARKFLVVDVGGQRNERRKWIHCFDKVTAILFVAALSEYDQVLLEDDRTNRLQEALKVFGEVTGQPFFAELPIIMFMNKTDLFAKKIEISPLKEHFPNYTGSPGFEDSAKFITDMFLKNRASSHKGEIYVHYTCATDTDNVHKVFESTKDIFIQGKIRDEGLYSTV
jgi:GTPase SAR1 family protein